MKPDYNLCDKCGEKTNFSITLVTGRENDGAGGMENITHNRDICGQCSISLIKYILRSDVYSETSYSFHKKVLDWI